MKITFQAMVYATTNLSAWTEHEAITDIQNKLEEGLIKVRLETDVYKKNILIVLEEGKQE